MGAKTWIPEPKLRTKSDGRARQMENNNAGEQVMSLRDHCLFAAFANGGIARASSTTSSNIEFLQNNKPLLPLL